jgi:hypothetical protein
MIYYIPQGMNWDHLSIGSSGSLIANLMLLAVMENIPALPPPLWDTVAHDPAPRVYATEWQPFLHNPGANLDPMPHACPYPRAEGYAFRLDHAPLPTGFDPHRQDEAPLHACVLVQPDGRITAVKLLGSTGSGRLDGTLRRTVLARWEFAPVARSPATSWQRVRLDSGPVEGAIPRWWPIH